MKRGRLPSTSEDSDNGSISTSWSQHSKSQHGRSSGSGHEDKKPSEVFRTDLITAMKLHDSYQLDPEEYYILADPWRQEWEKGVQVPVSQEAIPEPLAREVAEKDTFVTFTKPKKYIRSSDSEPPEPGYVEIKTLAEGVCRYDMNDMDVAWLELVNEEFKDMGIPELDEFTMEKTLEIFEQKCYDNMNHAIETEEGLGIEYDEDVVCDVCQSPDGEDDNEMVFCDKCNICVHQACYGILKVPEGSWLCRTCALGVQPKCLLCPKKGGAMKPTRSGTKWVHVSCALWIPEVSIGSPEKMEPITKVSHIPSSRWALVCSLCNEKTGASIQCSVKNCRTAFHVTCAFGHGLEMKTILTDSDEVKFKSYCESHSSCKKISEVNLNESYREGHEIQRTPSFRMDQKEQEAQRVSQRKQKLQELEDEFYTFVNVQEVSQDIALHEDTAQFLFQYWKLKRKANFNKPLITPKKDEEDNLAKKEQDVLIRRLQLFTHLRQDLERVRNLTYMLTRREKMKRSVCKVQEQIFNLYVKLGEHERLSGVHASCSAENMLLFNSKPAASNAPKIEDLKWHSAYFRKQLEKSHKRGELWHPNKSERILFMQPSSPKKYSAVVHTSCETYFVETGTATELQKNDLVVTERKRRDNHSRCEDTKVEIKDKHARPSHKSSRASGPPHKQAESKRAVTNYGGKSVQLSVQRPSAELTPRCSQTVFKMHYNQTAAKGPTMPKCSLKNWGGFKIPKKGEKQGGPQEEACQQNSQCQYSGKDSPNERDRTKGRLETDNENDGYVPDAEMSDSESEASEKKCRQQRLAPNSGINRRYETDIIRRSVLAS
ncbi:protein Jade-1 isoform X2 [Ambystoma mexicanum]